MFFSPSPSMSKARREQKWISRSTPWAGQTSPPVQRHAAWPVSRIARLPQIGQTGWSPPVGVSFAAIEKGCEPFGRLSSTTETTCGMTSPAR